jgi:hypothetical protein
MSRDEQKGGKNKPHIFPFCCYLFNSIPVPIQPTNVQCPTVQSYDYSTLVLAQKESAQTGIQERQSYEVKFVRGHIQ